MIQIQQLKLPVTHNREELEAKLCRTLKIKREQILSYRIVRQSIDARKKSSIQYVYTVNVSTDMDQKLIRRTHDKNIREVEKKDYQFPVSGTRPLPHHPVIAGSGPAGLFCAYMLAKAGYQPIVLERGKTVEERTRDVAYFWKNGALQPDSNVQFGEGGAGTFSDGKLNTLVRDTMGRNAKALEIFTAHGAPEEICYEARPHIGTDVLSKVIPAIRQSIIAMGGSFRFETCMTDLKQKDGRICAVELNHREWLNTDVLVLAIGHSARDTFEMLRSRGIPMEAKAFAVGLRVEHPQEMINVCQYGVGFPRSLPPAPYKVTARGVGERGIYSFCMCPGGHVVNASSEAGGLAVNGMSYHKRDSGNANSAIIVSVTPEDFGGEDPLSGVSYQRRLERQAFLLGEGRIPQQLFGDFKQKKSSASYGSFSSITCGDACFAPLHTLFSEEIFESFLCGMEQFSRKLHGFDREDAILSGVESRTSSPVRIRRNENFQSELTGLYPCGEGAGYAGGIMSAAMDGMKVAEMIAAVYAPEHPAEQEGSKF